MAKKKTPAAPTAPIITMTPDIAKRALDFLMSADLKGHEVVHFAQVTVALKQVADGKVTVWMLESTILVLTVIPVAITGNQVKLLILRKIDLAILDKR